ncbi:MAG: hypothetical protein U0930_26570 [Pirellulales bacterium]
MTEPSSNEPKSQSKDNPFEPPRKVDKHRPKPNEVTLVDILIAIVVVAALIASAIYENFWNN